MAKSKPTSNPNGPAQTVARGAYAIVFTVQVITATGNTGMQSILPAIGRETGIPDFLVAAIFSLSALLWAICSPIWAKQSDIHGRKPLILLGLAGFVVSMICCGLVVAAGVRHWAFPMLIFTLFLLARALFGLFGSAANPASQAYLAERSPRDQRTAIIANLAGAFAFGTVVGPIVGPFISKRLGLASPMFVFAAIALVAFVWVWRGLPEARKPKDKASPAAAAKGPKPPPLWKDKRIQPFLIYGLLVSTCQTAQYQTLGFIIIDKLNRPPTEALAATGVAMMIGAGAGLFAQWGLIRLFKMGPTQLLRWGAGIAAIANLVVALAPDYDFVVVGFAFSSLGYGFARPGFSAGASLAVGTEDQARAAGAVAAVNGLNVILAPLFVLLYGMFHPGPYLLNMVVLIGLLVFALRNSALRHAGVQPPEEVENAATVERNDASSGF